MMMVMMYMMTMMMTMKTSYPTGSKNSSRPLTYLLEHPAFVEKHCDNQDRLVVRNLFYATWSIVSTFKRF
jgi:hypothetical protein